MAPVAAQSTGSEFMGGIFQCAEVTAGEVRSILARLFPFPNSLFSVGMIGVVMILVHGNNYG
jgi:hypothetical protein